MPFQAACALSDELVLLTDPEFVRVRDQERGRMLKLLNDESDSKVIEASAKSEQPVRIASFEC